jgi:hypothetical protein
MAESIKQEDSNSGQPGQKMKPYLKNNQSKKAKKCGSKGRVSV